MIKKMKKVSAILTADWHLRETVPVCRTDDFWTTQWEKVKFVADLQKKYNCAVIHAGDLFDHWKPSPYLLSETFIHLPNKFYTVYGNHDLPQHNLELANKCGINVLVKANKINLLPNAHFGETPDEFCKYTFDNNHSLLVWHVMTWKNELPYPGCELSNAKALLKKYPQYDLIVTGDNHQTFVELYKGRILVNSGSLMRTNTTQINHKPCVFLWYAETNTIEQVFIPISENVISREHIEIQEKRNERIDAFISGLNTGFDSEISFQVNLEKFFANNKVRKNVKQLVYKFVEFNV